MRHFQWRVGLRPDRLGSSESGSIIPLMVVAVVLAGALTLGLTRLGVVAVSRAQAQAGADAAALAGAAEGRAAAAALAQANGGRLVSFTSEDGITRVVVRLGEVVAAASAVSSPRPLDARSGDASSIRPLET